MNYYTAHNLSDKTRGFAPQFFRVVASREAHVLGT